MQDVAKINRGVRLGLTGVILLLAAAFAGGFAKHGSLIAAFLVVIAAIIFLGSRSYFAAAFLAAFATILFVGEQVFIFWEFLFSNLVIYKQEAFWVITSDIATSGLCVIAVMALVVAWIQSAHARKQADEAEHSRLANIYTAIETRWASADTKRSRRYFRALINDYQSSGKKIDANFPTFVHKKLDDLSRSNPYKYMEAMSVIDFIEYLGMMEAQGYLRIDDLEPLIGEVVIQYDNFVGHHIKQIHEGYQRQAKDQQLTKVPETYALFTALAKKFKRRFL